MQVAVGSIIKSISSDQEDYFDDAIVLIVRHDDQGTIGFIVNRLSKKKSGEIVDFKNI